jgi:outer membrane protein assembly factor BamB
MQQRYVKVIWFVYVLLLLLVSGCATDNTPKPGPVPDIDNPEKVSITWNLGYLSRSAAGSFVPVIDQDNAIFTADSSGYIYKIDSSDGTTIFDFSVRRNLSSGTAVNADSIFVTTLDDYILCINKVTHEIKWQMQLPTLSIEAPQIAADLVIVRTNDASLLAYDVNSGKLKWVYQRPIPTLTLRATSTFQVAPLNDVIVYGQPGGRLSIINAQTGTSIWDTFFAVPVGSTDIDKLTDINMRPVINDDKTICLASYNGRIGCLDGLTSNVIWSNKFSTSVQLVVDKQNVYAVSQDGVVYAFDRKTGLEVWKNDKLQYRALGSLAFLGNNLVSVDSDGYINMFSKADGSLVARQGSNLNDGISYPLSNGYKVIMQSANGDIASFTNN